MTHEVNTLSLYLYRHSVSTYKLRYCLRSVRTNYVFVSCIGTNGYVLYGRFMEADRRCVSSIRPISVLERSSFEVVLTATPISSSPSECTR